MKHTKYLLMAFFALCLSASLHAQTTKKKSQTKKAKMGMHYQCPMKCEGEKTYHKNGKCPVCKMQMKPVKAVEASVKYQCPMKCEGEKMYSKAGQCPVCNMELKKVQYQCPMKCEGDKTYDNAGTCPVCKMDLTKVEKKKAKAGHEGHNHD